MSAPSGATKRKARRNGRGRGRFLSASPFFPRQHPLSGSRPPNLRLGPDHADRAVILGQGAQVLDVGPEWGHVVQHRAVLDGQRPGNAVEDAAAAGAARVARQGAFLDRGRTEVVDASTSVAGGVAREGGALGLQRSRACIVNAASLRRLNGVAKSARAGVGRRGRSARAASGLRAPPASAGSWTVCERTRTSDRSDRSMAAFPTRKRTT